MDITQQFKASVMTVKLQRRSELSQPNKNTLDKNRILSKGGGAGATAPKQRDEFALQAKDVCNKITNLRNVLLENRTAYMRIGQHLKRAATMTDEQRDLIDRESEKFVTYYTQHLAQMRADWKRVKSKQQERAHIEAVLDLLVSYLHSVQQIYLDQKKYRVQHELETYRLLKLAADKKMIPVRPAGEQSGKLRRRQVSSETEEEEENTDETDDRSETGWDDAWQWEDDGGDDNKTGDDKSDKQNLLLDDNSRSSRARKKQVAKSTTALQTNGETELKMKSSKVALDEDIQKSAEQQDDEDETNALSPEDVQMFEEENMQLYHELQGLTEEVEQIEKNVVDIAQLQDIFTEKVTLQNHNIDRIVSAVVGATENVKDANEQIRQATQRNAGIRVWSLFFLLVMSFSLLFLDWYYD